MQSEDEVKADRQEKPEIFDKLVEIFKLNILCLKSCLSCPIVELNFKESENLNCIQMNEVLNFSTDKLKILIMKTG